MKNIYLALAICLMIGTAGCKSFFSKELTPAEKARQQALAETLPFDVQIGGQQATFFNEYCSKIPEKISNDAEIKVDVESKDPIVLTISPGTPEGLVQPGKKPVLLTTKSCSTTLDKTDTGKKLAPGLYVIYINADNKIASVIFEIEKPTKK